MRSGGRAGTQSDPQGGACCFSFQERCNESLIPARKHARYCYRYTRTLARRRSSRPHASRYFALASSCQSGTVSFKANSVTGATPRCRAVARSCFTSTWTRSAATPRPRKRTVSHRQAEVGALSALVGSSHSKLSVMVGAGG